MFVFLFVDLILFRGDGGGGLGLDDGAAGARSLGLVFVAAIVDVGAPIGRGGDAIGTIGSIGDDGDAPWN